MNTTDVDIPEGKYSSDALGDIFKYQQELEERYGDIENKNLPGSHPRNMPVSLHTHEGQRFLRDSIFWTIIELGEAADCLKNKPWKSTMMETDVNHFKEELIDALHFFIKTCLLAGIDAKELYQLYLKKRAVNQFRQGSNY